MALHPLTAGALFTGVPIRRAQHHRRRHGLLAWSQHDPVRRRALQWATQPQAAVLPQNGWPFLTPLLTLGTGMIPMRSCP